MELPIFEIRHDNTFEWLVQWFFLVLHVKSLLIDLQLLEFLKHSTSFNLAQSKVFKQKPGLVMINVQKVGSPKHCY